MNRHKDKDPRETVERIKGILAELGIRPHGELVSFADTFFSMRIEDPVLKIGTNGKGASPDLAWASAYGEFMERLQSDFLIKTSDKSLGNEGFYAWPDERIATFDEALGACPVVLRDLERNFVSGDDVRSAFTDAVDPEESLAFWRSYVGETISMIPYYCVGTGQLVEMPDTIINKIDQSNGLAAGNTPEEALVEGMSEICERYAKAVILNDELCPPRIPREFIEEHCPAQAEMLRAVEERSPELNVIVLDASLGRGIPAVSMLFIDQQRGTIRPKFGAHPCISIALERCMTEQYQGCVCNGESVLSRLFTSWDAWSRKTVHSFALSCAAYGSDQGIVPDRMLLNEPDWEFEPWGIDEGFTNKRGARQLAGLLRGIGGEVYIRSCGYLGMPAFRIYVPGVTGLFSPGGSTPLLTKEFGMQVTCAFAAYEKGDFVLAADFLKLSKNTRDLCAAQELLCRAEGVSEKQRDILLEAYFGSGAAAYAKAVWRSDDPETALRDFKRRENLFKALGSGFKKKSGRHEAYAELKAKLRQRKLANPVDQMLIGAVFE